VRIIRGTESTWNTEKPPQRRFSRSVHKVPTDSTHFESTQKNTLKIMFNDKTPKHAHTYSDATHPQDIRNASRLAYAGTRSPKMDQKANNKRD